MNKNIEVLRGLRERLVRINRDTDGDNHINESCDALDELDAALAAMGGQGEGRYPCPRGYDCRGRDCPDCANFTAPQQPEARVGGEVDATDRVKFNWNEHLREHNALEYQHDFRLFEVVCSYVTKHLDDFPTTPPPSAMTEWRPIETVPNTSEVVLFCDKRGNRWTQCAHSWDIPECGLPASLWMPLPAAPKPEEG